jgi:CDP-paratose 2-epimerase
MQDRIVVTGSGGLVGSEIAAFFAPSNEVHGIDNNMRAEFFGSQGDTSWNVARLQQRFARYVHHRTDIRDRQAMLDLFEQLRPAVVVHTAAQPSHDWAASRPFDDFDVNAVGTLNLLEAARRFSPDAVFVHFSTNKVYGDAPNEIPLVELPKRWDYADPQFADGIAETFRIDRSKHSLFGASKAAADLLVQEYGRYFGLRCCCLRGGCLTGPNHAGVELHGFLSYLVKVNLEGGVYRVYGYKGKQVRDNIHSLDIVRFVAAFVAEPRCAEIYNLGGGRQNSCSILEAFDMVEQLTGRKMRYEYVDKNREGDHICYISDLRKMRNHYRRWDITISLEEIVEDIVRGWHERGLG